MLRVGPDPRLIAQVAKWLEGSESVLFITGAGVSVASGLPTYRGVGGLYDGVETEGGVPIEQALSGIAMRRDPESCWRLISEIETHCRGALPNRAHEVIAAFEKELDRVVVLTQNVDGLHLDAGSQAVIEIHGNLRHLDCTGCGFALEVRSYEGLAMPPGCPVCRSMMRPRVVLFGEMLPTDAVAEYERQLGLGFDLVMCLGTTAAFPYIAHPVLEARAQGRPTVEVNPETTPLSRVVDLRLGCGAEVALDAVWTSFTARR
jgi:NAD-dependent deacetylase